MQWKPLNYLTSAVVTLGGLALIVLIVTTGWQVYGRYVLNDTPTWAERLSLLLILLVSLPVAAVGLREDFHLGISLLVEMMPKRLQRLVLIFNATVLALFGAAMAFFSWGLVTGTWNRTIPLIGVPQAFQYIPLVICGVLIVVFMVERIVGLVRAPVIVEPPAGEVAEAVRHTSVD